MKYCETCNATYPTGFNTCPKDQTVLRVASELMPGLVIRDKYEILEKIGSGGMATVYRVKHLAFNEERAIKVVSSKLMDDPNFIKRFRTEAIISRKLQHPNAVRVDDLDTTDDGRLFMVMEYVKGQDLRHVLQHSAPLPLDRALHITWQVSSALATAHQQGITHRDIKPDNILLVWQPSGKDLVKVLDFGIAKVKEGTMDVGGGYTATQTGIVVGTPQYISPEQAMGRGGEQIDGRADLYSLGIVIYEMLTAKLPFESDTAMGLLLHHLQTTPTPPHLMRPDLNIPPAISMVLMKALEKDPAKRFQNANEMLDALAAAKKQAAAQTGVATRAITPTGMAAAATPAPDTMATMPISAAATPTYAPTVAAPKAAPAAAKPIPVVDKTVAIAPPRKITAPAARTAPKPVPQPPSGRRWLVPALVAILVLGALGMVVRQHRKATAETPPPVVAQPVSAPVQAAPAPEPAVPASTPSQPEVAAKPDATPPATKPAPRKKAPAEEAAPAETAAAQPAQGPMDPDVRRLLLLGKQQYENHRYGQAMSSFRAVLALDPNNQWAQRGIEACKEARQQQSEQVLQNDQPQQGNQGYQNWRRRRPN
jgi:eukaryotic-like serine/threonine-protein kinase